MMQTVEFSSDTLPYAVGLKDRERLLNARLREAVGGVCDMTCANIDNSHHGHMQLCLAPEIVVGRLSRLAVSCHRGKAHIGQDGDDSLFVQINVGSGRIGGRQFGRDYDLAPGHATFCVHNASVDFTSHEGADLIGITLPRHMTDDWTVAPEDLAARVVPLERPALSLLASYANLFRTQPNADAGLVSAAAHHMAFLIGTGFGGLEAMAGLESRVAAVGEARLSAVRDLMRRNCTTGDLTAGHVGRALGISARMVQHILQRQGTSFSRQMADYRAARARTMLRDPAFAAVSTAEIGFQCGFNDISSFYRAFRRCFSVTPGEMRGQTQPHLR